MLWISKPQNPARLPLSLSLSLPLSLSLSLPHRPLLSFGWKIFFVIWCSGGFKPGKIWLFYIHEFTQFLSALKFFGDSLNPVVPEHSSHNELSMIPTAAFRLRLHPQWVGIYVTMFDDLNKNKDWWGGNMLGTFLFSWKFLSMFSEKPFLDGSQLGLPGILP